METCSRKGFIVTAVTVVLAILAPGELRAQCSPIPPGHDAFPSTGKIVLELLPPFGNGTPEVIRLGSSGLPNTLVQREGQVGNSIATELVQLELTGVGALAGKVALHEDPAQASVGRIDRIEQDPITCALVSGESLFDAFLKIDVSSLGTTLYNQDPVRILGPIRSLPPVDSHLDSPEVSPVLLYDVSNPFPSGPPVARLSYGLEDEDPLFPLGANDCFDLTAGNGIEIFPPFIPGGYTADLASSGSLHVSLSDPFDPGTGLQTIDTKIIDLDLHGTDSILGDFTIMRHPSVASVGQCTENPAPDATYPADSFFGVFVQIASAAVGTLQTIPPIGNRVEATAANGTGLRTIPPGVSTSWNESSSAPRAPLFNPAGTTQVGWFYGLKTQVTLNRSCDPPPPAGRDCTDASLEIDLNVFDPFVPGGCSETFSISGRSKILRQQPLDPGDGRSVIDQLFERFEMLGSSACLGATTVRLPSDSTSAGRFRSLQAPENFPGDSFFDAFFELDTSVLGVLQTTAANALDAAVDAVPLRPGETHYYNGDPVPLFGVGGAQIGTIAVRRHRVDATTACQPTEDPGITFRSKTMFEIGVALAGGGPVYDLIRADLADLRATGTFGSAICLVNDGPSNVTDLAVPNPGGGFVYVSREKWGTFVGSWNAGEHSGLAADRDLTILACP
jgi:hypothetical protein